MIILVGMNPVNSERKPFDPKVVENDPNALIFARCVDDQMRQLVQHMYEVEFVSAVTCTAERESAQPSAFRLMTEKDPGNSVLLRPGMYNGPHLSTIANVALAKLVYAQLLFMLQARKVCGACITRRLPSDPKQLTKAELAYITYIAKSTPGNFLRGSTK